MSCTCRTGILHTSSLPSLTHTHTHLSVSQQALLDVSPPGSLNAHGSTTLFTQKEQLVTQVGHIGYHHLGGERGSEEGHLVLSSAMFSYVHYAYLFIREGVGHILVLGDEWHTSQEGELWKQTTNTAHQHMLKVCQSMRSILTFSASSLKLALSFASSR